MKQFTAIYLHQVNQCLHLSQDTLTINDAIIEQIFENSAQLPVYIMFTNDFALNFQKIIQTNSSMKFKNSIIFVCISYNSNQNELDQFIIDKEIHNEHCNFMYFDCQLSQNMAFLPIHKIITRINQLSYRQLHTPRIEHINQSIESNVTKNINVKIPNEKKSETNFEMSKTKADNEAKLGFTNKMPRKFTLKEFCSEIVLNTDASINIINFATKNIQIPQKFINDEQQLSRAPLNPQQNLCFSPSLASKTFLNCQNSTKSTSIQPTNNEYLKNIAALKNEKICDSIFCTSSRAHHYNVINNNSQSLLNYQARSFEIFENNDYPLVVASKPPYLHRNILNSNASLDQNIHEKSILLQSYDFIITMEKEKNDNLQMENIEWQQIIQLPKTQFDQLLQSMLCKIVNDSINKSPIIKEAPTPEGAICIELSLLQHEIQNASSKKLISLMNLLKNRFQYFTYVYSEDSHERQLEIIKKFPNKLQIDGFIWVNSNLKASKWYDSTIKQYICTFPSNKEDWPDIFEINRNNVFAIYNNENKISAHVFEETLEYQDLFEALHKIYEDQMILEVFNKQDKLLEQNEKLLYDTNDFVLCSCNGSFYIKNEGDQIFLLKENTDRIFFSTASQPYISDAQEQSEMVEYMKLFALKMYLFFGVNAPFCCLTYQPINFDYLTKDSNNTNSSKLCLMIEYVKECQHLPQSFVSDYKNSNDQYYYYPSTHEDGPLVGFGLALLVAYLLNDDCFFGDEFENVCFIKKIGYFEFTKRAINNIFLIHDNNEENPSDAAENANIILTSSGESKITFEELCDYDKFEFVTQISKLYELENYGKELWDQFISTQYNVEFTYFQSVCAARIQKIAKLLLKGNQIKLSQSKKINLPPANHAKSQINSTTPLPFAPSNLLDEKNTFFTREQKYITEEAEIGAGCFGVVSVAHLIKDPTKKFALKRLFDNKRILREDGEINAGKDSTECNYKQEHDRELEALMKVKRIRSPFLVGYIGAQLLKHEIKGTYRLELIMELCDGDLSSYLKNLKNKNKKLDLSDCYTIFCQIVEGLRMLHKNGIMHRDIKPQNILYKRTQIEGDEVVIWKIGDFGLASMKTLLNNAAGTPEYMAPEILCNKEYDKSVDIWSLGLLFHKILFGYSYYSKNNLESDYKLLPRELEKIDKETNVLLMRMMETNYNERITIEEIHEEIKDRKVIKAVKKILSFEEDNERNQRKRKNPIEEQPEEVENVSKLKEIDEILENVCEWNKLGCYNKTYNMLMDTLLVIRKLKHEKIQNYLWKILHYIGHTTYYLGKYKKTLQYCEESLIICTQIHGERSKKIVSIFNDIGHALQSFGKYEEALIRFDNALSICIQQYGGQHIKTAHVYKYIGNILQSQCKYREAFENYIYALPIITMHYGEQHIQTAAIYENIGITLQSFDKYQEALTYCNKALSVFIRQFGEFHIVTASTYNNIGNLLQSLGKYEDALKYYNFTLSIEIKTFGSKHICVAQTYQNIGYALQLLGKHEEAMIKFNHVLSIYIKHYGEQSVETALIYYSIGTIIEQFEQYEDALMRYNYAVTIILKQYGEHHAYIPLIYESIGTVLRSLGKYEESLQYLNFSLKIKKQIYGNQHIQVATTYENIGHILESFGKYEEAILSYNWALSIKARHYGKQHIETLSSYNNIGNLLQLLGKYEEALMYFNSMLSSYIKQYGDFHACLAPIYNNIGNTLARSGQPEEALKYYNCVLYIMIQQHGEYHIQTALTYADVGNAFFLLNQYDKALMYYNYALQIFIKQYGKQHIQTALTYDNIGNTLIKVGRHEEGFAYLNYALPIFIQHYGQYHNQTIKCINSIRMVHHMLQYQSQIIPSLGKNICNCLCDNQISRISNIKILFKQIQIIIFQDFNIGKILYQFVFDNSNKFDYN